MLIQNINGTPQEAPVYRSSASTPEPVSPKASQPGRSTSEPAVTDNQLKTATEAVNATLKQNNSSLQFSVDGDTNITVVKLVDTETGDVIRQIPSKEMLAIARSIDQVRQGLLLKQEA